MVDIYPACWNTVDIYPACGNNVDIYPACRNKVEISPPPALCTKAKVAKGGGEGRVFAGHYGIMSSGADFIVHTSMLQLFAYFL